jgi:TetR/AcrR family transcriptional repressor of nem operon
MMFVIQETDGHHTECQEFPGEHMGHSQADKAASRARILAAAAAQIRESGFDSVSVASVMRSAELTHGGFYNHFGSRAELITAALSRALEESVLAKQGKPAASDAPDPESLRRFVRSYLSRTHRDNRQSGCAIAALAAEVGRADLACREVMNGYVEGFFELVEHALGADHERDALVAVCAMVGALQISRVLTDEKRSDQVLKAVRDAVGVLTDEA